MKRSAAVFVAIVALAVSSPPAAFAFADGQANNGSGASIRTEQGPRIDTSVPALHFRTIRPDEVDSPEAPADDFIADQFATLDTRAERMQGRLVVFLAGATSPPDRTMTEYLASLGFHVLAPHYSNAYGIPTICPQDPDPDCHRLGRQEAFEGTDLSPFIDITRGNSIEERVTRMLKFLVTDMPEGDWGFFLDGDLPRWDRITISGTSHGASTSGLIGMIRRTERVVMLSGPSDNIDGQPAAWTHRTPLTPIERFFGFSHTADAQLPDHLRDFEAMGLLGTPTSVDGATPPFGGSHRLTTSADSTNGHVSTKAGAASPQNPDGTFLFDPVWRSIYGVC
ncbi:MULTISPECIES: BPSS1187 family protein [unclassified Micromonospora]|uniref:BPSS1187 family protein n=1 Tax=unclassified Micromonospora TaxID=2617518 RepID=UPI00363CB838